MARGECLHLEKTLPEDGEEVKLYCYSERRADKEEAINERFAKRFEAALDKIAGGVDKPRTTKRINKLRERIGRFKAKSRGIGQHYKIELICDDTGEKAVALRYERKPVAGSSLTNPGIYCQRSSETDWNAQKLWHTHIMHRS